MKKDGNNLNSPHVLRARVESAVQRARAESRGGWEQSPQRAPSSAGDLCERIEKISALSSLSDWEKNFVDSIKNQYEARGSLSPRQVEILEKIDKKTSPEALATSAAWFEQWDEKKREILEVCAQYYLPTGYYTKVSHQVLNEPDFIPTEKLYRKMCENKYAKRVLEAWFSPDRYPVGDMVALRTTAPYHLNRVTPSGRAIVLRTNSMVPQSAAKGAKIYEILPLGASKPVLAEERHLKKVRKKKN